MPYGGLVVLKLVTCANIFGFVADSQAHKYITTSPREGNDMYFPSNQFTRELGYLEGSPRCLSLHCTGVNEKASTELRSPVIDIGGSKFSLLDYYAL
ncbi:hypothetical protein BDZ89DRAFT_1082831, partial [Hymenopellis radicata]